MAKLPTKTTSELLKPVVSYTYFSREFLDSFVTRFEGDFQKKVGVGPTESAIPQLYSHLMSNYENIRAYLNSDGPEKQEMSDQEKSLLEGMSDLSSYLWIG